MRATLQQLLVRTAHGLTLVLLTLALLVFVALGIGPRTGHYQTATVLTGSMRPTIPEGSIVVITPLEPGDVRVGDVVTYQIPVEDRRVVTHRVVQVVERGEHPVVRTQGDANDAPDAWTARMDGGPLWKVRAHVPMAGYGLQALRQPFARRFCVFVLPLVLCLVWLRDIWFPQRQPSLA